LRRGDTNAHCDVVSVLDAVSDIGGCSDLNLAFDGGVLIDGERHDLLGVALEIAGGGVLRLRGFQRKRISFHRSDVSGHRFDLSRLVLHILRPDDESTLMRRGRRGGQRAASGCYGSKKREALTERKHEKPPHTYEAAREHVDFHAAKYGRIEICGGKLRKHGNLARTYSVLAELAHGVARGKIFPLTRAFLQGCMEIKAVRVRDEECQAPGSAIEYCTLGLERYFRALMATQMHLAPADMNVTQGRQWRSKL